jgi:hypothetical protein
LGNWKLETTETVPTTEEECTDEIPCPHAHSDATCSNLMQNDCDSLWSDVPGCTDSTDFGSVSDTCKLTCGTCIGSCSDGIHQPRELGIDCGGVCPDCECDANTNCPSGYDCVDSRCVDDLRT